MSIKSGGFVKCRYGYIAAVANPTRPASNGTVTVETGTTWYIYDTPTLGCTGAGLFIGCTPDSSGVGGTATVNLSGGTIDLRSHGTGAGVTVGQSGTVSGNGTLTLSGSTTAMSQTAVVYGTLAPGTGAGLTIIGNVDLTAGLANTVIHVTPLAETSESVHVDAFDGGSSGGLATLGGRLTVIVSGTFTELPVDFTLLEAGTSLNGTIFRSQSITLPPSGPCIRATINYDYDANKVTLHLASCASPGGPDEP